MLLPEWLPPIVTIPRHQEQQARRSVLLGPIAISRRFQVLRDLQPNITR